MKSHAKSMQVTVRWPVDDGKMAAKLELNFTISNCSAKCFSCTSMEMKSHRPLFANLCLHRATSSV